MRLQGKRALVTGASRGIGKSIALNLAKEGAEVVVNYRSQENEAQQVVDQIKNMGSRGLAVQGSTHIFNNVKAIVQTSLDFLGKIDILVNNAGILTRTAFLEIPEEEWNAIVETNLTGYFLMGQAVASSMVENAVCGSIVNVSSVLQSVTAPNLTHYSVSKAGVGMLTKQMALELAPKKIRVNAVAPGLISTDMNSKDLEKLEFRDSVLNDIPLNIIGQPEDITGSVVFLCSDKEARLITGTTIFIDGGRSLK
ncbi:MAG: glucose 1-dehydrogenase [bacterium]